VISQSRPGPPPAMEIDLFLNRSSSGRHGMLFGVQS
jgi:hypothetical protein